LPDPLPDFRETQTLKVYKDYSGPRKLDTVLR